MGRNICIYKPGNRLLILTVAGLLLLCVNPGWTQGEHNRNLLLAAAMSLSPLVLLIRRCRILIPRIDLPLSMVCVCVIAFPLIFHPESIRWITMLFTCACCVYFMMLARLISVSGITGPQLCRVIRIMVYCFAGVLVIQQICLLLGWPIPLNGHSWYSTAPWKLNSLTAEPSHTTVTLATAMFFYTRTLRYENPESNLPESLRTTPWLWISYVWAIFSTVNSSALLLGPLCLLPYITRRNLPGAASALAGVLLLIFLTPVGDLPQICRLRDTIKATLTLDERAMMEADLSASARTVPTLRGAKLINPSDVRTWIGYGVDADQRDTAPRPCDLEEKGFAGVFSMWHNYGAICALAYWTAIAMTTLRRRDPLSWIAFLFAMQMSADHNMQLVWMIMAFGYTYSRITGNPKPLNPKAQTSKA